MKNTHRLKFVLIIASVTVASLTAMTWATGRSHIASASGNARFVSAPDVANIPRAFSYQGTLRLADGNLANGSYAITLRICDAVTGGNTLHTETFNNTVVRNGSFSVVVGDATPIGATVFDNANLYLGITVAPDAEMLPRQRLFPVPWALQAGIAKNAESANKLNQNASGDGLSLISLNSGAVTTPGLTISSTNATGGWGSGLVLQNNGVPTNWAWGMRTDRDGSFQIANYGSNTTVMSFQNGGGIYVSPTLNTNQINAANLNASGRVAAATFSGWCGVYPGNVTNVVYCNQDVAETFATDQRTEPGDVVVFIPEDRATPSVKLSSTPNGGGIVGVVSTNPGLVFDNGETHLAGPNDNFITDKKTVVAMIGRVPVKVSLENGAIAVGDPLTSGSKPGTAMKATQAGQIIGYAIQSSDAAKDGKILVWLQLGTYVPKDALAALNSAAALQQQVSALAAEVAKLKAGK